MFIKKELIKYSLSNIKKRKGRSFMTILSVFIGIATIFIFLSFGLGLYAYMESFITESSANKVMITGGAGTFDMGAYFDQDRGFSKEDLRAVERASGVQDVSGIYFKVVSIESQGFLKYTFLITMEPEKRMYEEIGNMEIEIGRPLRTGDSGSVVLGYSFRKDGEIFPKALELGDRIMIDGRNFRVVGFYESVGNPQDDAQLYINNDYFEILYPNNTKYSVVMATVDTERIDEVVENIERNLRRSRNVERGEENFFVASFEDLLATFNDALNIIIGFVILIALISIVVSSINTANTMISSVLERIQEIGTMKSVGARNSEIFKLFLFESSFLGFIAGVIGVILGFIFSYIAGKVLIDLGYGFLQPVFPWQLFVGCVLFATITGAISGTIPAWNASRINPVEALRYE